MVQFIISFAQIAAGKNLFWYDMFQRKPVFHLREHFLIDAKEIFSTYHELLQNG